MARVYESDRRIMRSAPSTLAVVALIIALTALGIAWLAYNRSGEDLEAQIQQGIEESTNNADDAAEDAGGAAQDASDTIEQGIDAGPDGIDDGSQ